MRTAVDVYNTTLLLSGTTISDQTNVNTTPGTTGASTPSAPVPTPEPRRSSRLRPSEGKTDEDNNNDTDGDSEEDAGDTTRGRSPRLLASLNPVQPVRLTFEECNIKPHHAKCMYESRLSKILKASSS